LKASVLLSTFYCSTLFRLRRVGVVGFEPTVSGSRNRRNCQAFPYAEMQSAQRESNPRFRHGKAVGCRYIMGACVVTELSCQRANDRESTGSDSNRRFRITGAESSPLNDQCLWGQESRAEGQEPGIDPALVSRLSTLDYAVGPEGFEPSPAWLRARCAASNTSVP
jgi:hypothetical protein